MNQITEFKGTTIHDELIQAERGWGAVIEVLCKPEGAGAGTSAEVDEDEDGAV